LEKPVEASSIIGAFKELDITLGRSVARITLHASLRELRAQLVGQIDTADAIHEPLLAARLYEAVEAIDQFLKN